MGETRQIFRCKDLRVFDTIAAESQRLINETYSAFVQGFMPTLARPEVDVLEGDAAKARQVLGWAPEVGLEALAAEMVDADLARHRARLPAA